jgi:hypothetical protein
MFMISGTKRSGTSMWMQALTAAGVPILGDPFPKNWANGALRLANPDGFYEGLYRDGIFFGTNPHPDNGQYLRAEDTRGTAVKVFIPGVVRSELAFIDGVIANIREWREYEASVNRLWALEDEQRAAEAPDKPIPLRVPGALEWWGENFALLRDRFQRGYPLLLHTYDEVLADPATCVARALALIGAGDLDKAIAAIDPHARTQTRPASDSVEPRIARVFDELYFAIANRTPIEGALQRLLVDTDRELQPQLLEIKMQRVRRSMLAGERPPAAFLMAASMT